MAAVSQRSSGIPQPVAKPSRLMSMQAQFQQKAAADRQKKLGQQGSAAPIADSGRSALEPPRHAAANGRATIEPGLRPAAPAPSAPRARPGGVTAGSVHGSASASAAQVNGGTGGGKVRAMFNSRRAGNSAHTAVTSPVGWDKSYPLDPIGAKKPSASSRPVTGPSSANNHATNNGVSRPSAPSVSAARAGAAAARARRPVAAREPPAPAPAPAVAATSRRPAPPRAAPAPARLAPAPAADRSAASARAPPTPASSLKENKPPAPRAAPTDPNMAQCPICSRSFAKDRIDKHQIICEKSSKKKRKVFDPVKMRVQGTESEAFVRRQQKSKKPEPAPAKKDWRKQHEEFIRNIRAAKKAQAILAAGGSIKDLPPPPPMDTSDYVQCPHCSRRFNEAAADRHIPKCANISSNKAGAGRAAKPAARGATAARLRR